MSDSKAADRTYDFVRIEVETVRAGTPMVDTALKIAAIIFLCVASIAIAANFAPWLLVVGAVVVIYGGAILLLVWIYRKWRRRVLLW